MKVQLDPTPHQSTTGTENILQYGTQKIFELGSFKNRKHMVSKLAFSIYLMYIFLEPFFIMILKFNNNYDRAALILRLSWNFSSWGESWRMYHPSEIQRNHCIPHFQFNYVYPNWSCCLFCSNANVYISIATGKMIVWTTISLITKAKLRECPKTVIEKMKATPRILGMFKGMTQDSFLCSSFFWSWRTKHMLQDEHPLADVWHYNVEWCLQYSLHDYGSVQVSLQYSILLWHSVNHSSV